MTTAESASSGVELAEGAFGVNYALRPHKFVDRRIFMEALARFARFAPLENYAYVGLGSFALEDHKIINSFFGINALLSLEIEPDVVKRQLFNNPLSCIYPTPYSTAEFLERKEAILAENGISAEKNLIVWFDTTDAQTIRVHLDSFGELLRQSRAGDVLRFTVDVDQKTFGRKAVAESLDDLDERRFQTIRDLLGDQMPRGTKAVDIRKPLGIARLVTHAFELIAAEQMSRRDDETFELLSITTYADGHRMLSITGSVLNKKAVRTFRRRACFVAPGASKRWTDLIAIQIPQLTTWEKLSLDKLIPNTPVDQIAIDWGFRLHDQLSTPVLLRGYSDFQRFYPNFRHVLL